MTTTNSQNGPVQAPPGAESSSGAAGTSAPTITDEQVAALNVDLAVAPTLTPSAAVEAAGAGAGAVTVTWHTNVQIDALWAIDQPRNAFIHIVGVGWRKIVNLRDGAFLALVTLAGQARQTNRPTSLREEADGMIYEIYLW
ncbi:hypothetical protein [Kribbella sp. NPDC003557]|uniref:hypothetical protein n=1 Tax=Kribbella sp. NPDC003557 TaxID=3154449 RepID=UPI0033B0A78F